MRITVVEDNESLANAIAFRLRDRGHAVDLLTNGKEAEMFILQEGSDLIVLDANLPGKDGFSVLSTLRSEGCSTPVIMVTARTGTCDRVAGLDSGADDYLTKPFEMDELEARIRALSRRQSLVYVAIERFGRLEFNRTARQLSVDGEPVDLPRKEISVLECLIERQGRLVSKAQLIDHVYGVGADVDDTAIEPHISRLRQRLKCYDIRIKTARGLGYMLERDT